MFWKHYKPYMNYHFRDSGVEDWCEHQAIRECLMILMGVIPRCPDENMQCAEVREALDYAIGLSSGVKQAADRFWKALAEGDPVTRPFIVQEACKTIYDRLEPMTHRWEHHH